MELRSIVFRVSSEDSEGLVKKIDAEFEFEIPFRLTGFNVCWDTRERFSQGNMIIRWFPCPITKKLIDDCLDVLARFFEADLPNGDYIARYEKGEDWPTVSKRQNAGSGDSYPR